MLHLEAHQLPVKRTPWGKPDYGERYADGITRINTPGHGGFYLSRARLAAMRKQFPVLAAHCADGAFFEEDSAWCAVAITFPQYFLAKDLDAAWDTLRNWYPAAWEAIKGRTLRPGESARRDDETFERESANKFTVKAAWGDWEETTPKGFVKVFAKRASDGAEKYFLIPEAAYKSPGRMICDGYPETTPEKGGSGTKCLN